MKSATQEDDGEEAPRGAVGNSAPTATQFHVIPAIDLLDGRVVRLREGDLGQPTFYGADAVSFAAQWEGQGAARLHLVDLEGAVSGSPVQQRVIRQVIESSAVPCQVAGGIRTIERAVEVLGWGADRVVMGTALLHEPQLARKLVQQVGPQRVVAAIDVRDGLAIGSGWVRGASGAPFEEAMARLADAGIATFAVTAIARDGLQQGPDWALLDRAAAVVGARRIIASGGVTSIDDVARLARDRFGAAILGRALYEGTIGLPDALRAASAAIEVP